MGKALSRALLIKLSRQGPPQKAVEIHGPPAPLTGAALAMAYELACNLDESTVKLSEDGQHCLIWLSDDVNAPGWYYWKRPQWTRRADGSYGKEPPTDEDLRVYIVQMAVRRELVGMKAAPKEAA